ncbi:MAG: hypothetical protein HLUCCX14_11010 [Marinobacter excellens HL-55]|uniref:Uncharacterized protein n=1 Tax=Marinobacter excellens HL-55 TaxID=1305731 RepID=A0A0N8KKJ6_9GAMM|nr:MAG: hypothetical protein HLUCCX14_11010 [Marinobacter excellens HL-55]
MFVGDSGEKVEADKSIENAPGFLFDALVLPDGSDAVEDRGGIHQGSRRPSSFQPEQLPARQLTIDAHDDVEDDALLTVSAHDISPENYDAQGASSWSI